MSEFQPTQSTDPERQAAIDAAKLNIDTTQAAADAVRAESEARQNQPLQPLEVGAVTEVRDPFSAPPNPNLAFATGDKDESRAVADKTYGLAANFTKQAGGSTEQSSFAPVDPNRTVDPNEIPIARAAINKTTIYLYHIHIISKTFIISNWIKTQHLRGEKI